MQLGAFPARHPYLQEVCERGARRLAAAPQPAAHLAQQLAHDGGKVLVDCLPGVVHQRAPDVRHRVLRGAAAWGRQSLAGGGAAEQGRGRVQEKEGRAGAPAWVINLHAPNVRHCVLNARAGSGMHSLRGKRGADLVRAL
eukprot:350491-Chlamydomonas_euryale.AAC.2